MNATKEYHVARQRFTLAYNEWSAYKILHALPDDFSPQDFIAHYTALTFAVEMAYQSMTEAATVMLLERDGAEIGNVR